MQQYYEPLASRVRGRKVAFIGAGVSHRELIGQFVEMGAQVTLCDKRTADQMGELAGQLAAKGVALSLGTDYMQGFAGQDMIMRTPALSSSPPNCRPRARPAPRSPARWSCSLNSAPARSWR